MKKPTAKGFTLLELLTAITIAGILLGIGIPSFSSTLKKNRVAASSNELLTSLSYARSEALKRGVGVAVCKLNSARTGCDTATAATWKYGWLVFEDQAGTKGVFDSTDVLIQKLPQLNDDLLLSANANFVRYKSNGSPDPGISLVKLDLSAADGSLPRCIQVELSGGVTLHKDITCP